MPNRIKELIFSTCACEFDEVFGEVRKGVPQSKYIIQIKAGTYDDWELGNYDIPIPDEMVGYWMQEYYTDLRYTPLSEELEDLDQWVKCKPVEVKVIDWVQI